MRRKTTLGYYMLVHVGMRIKFKRKRVSKMFTQIHGYMFDGVAYFQYFYFLVFVKF